MSIIVGIQFRSGGKTYYFDPNGIEFVKGEGAIVETTRGTEYGSVVIANRDVSQNEIVGELKSVVRKATEKDLAQHIALNEKRKKAIREAQELADKHKLDMKIVDVDFYFDNSKVVFFFTADNRVDFRELVKDLASTYRMRIELRQIGIRDECKMKGGLGPCGRPCCCSAYMTDFQRVSIKMAKNQGLSLNPTKISGLCDRLMCCLKFEDDYYVETLKFLPKLNSEIETPAGKGKVESVDALRLTVTVRITNSQDETEVKTFTLAELGIEPIYTKSCNGCTGDDCGNCGGSNSDGNAENQDK